MINGDVEWAHAIAPGANIVLLVPPSNLIEDIDEATYYAATAGIGNVVSGSYYTPERFVGSAEADKENLISELAAVMGVATNAGLTAFTRMPCAALNADGSMAWQTGWETHVSLLMSGGVVHDPSVPLDFTGFAGGSGGGTSGFFSKPAFQKALSGKGRMVPDIAWLADADTGGLIVVSQAETYPPQIWYAYGGTELATPMFSALWAIANQEAGGPLGQAAPYLYRMPASTITDMVLPSSTHNVASHVELSAAGAQRFNPWQTLSIIAPKEFGAFYSAYGADPDATIFDVSFGQDYFLHLATGWDPITGLGAPNPQAFADWFRASSR